MKEEEDEGKKPRYLKFLPASSLCGHPAECARPLGMLERRFFLRFFFLRWLPKKMARSSLCLSVRCSAMSQSNRLDTAAPGFFSSVQHHYDGSPEQIQRIFRRQRVVMEKRYHYTVSRHCLKGNPLFFGTSERLWSVFRPHLFFASFYARRGAKKDGVCVCFFSPCSFAF